MRSCSIVFGMKTCTADDCDREPRNRTSPYCEKHYSRFRRHGDPNVVLKDHTPARERWKKLYTVNERTGCWEWAGQKSRGYGVISDGAGKQHTAHRLVWEEMGGVLKEGLELDHLCKNRGCVNPAHIEQVHHTINVRRGGVNGSNFTKTECKYGHEFTPENTYVRSNGWRSCRACDRRLMREHHARQGQIPRPFRAPVFDSTKDIAQCEYGHIITTKNKYVNGRGQLVCRSCARAGRKTAIDIR